MEYGILSGNEIVENITKGLISITPFIRKHVNPVSVDLTLGKQVSVYKSVINGDWSKNEDGIVGGSIYPHSYNPPKIQPPSSGYLDARVKNEVLEYELEDGEAILLKPGIGYLMHTAERVWTDTFVPVLDGKSSIGRLFTMVHVTAGYGDPGFNGQYTLEVVVINPVIIYAGMRICQMRFHTICGRHISYQDTGSYKGNLAEGPVPSYSYKMFRE